MSIIKKGQWVRVSLPGGIVIKGEIVESGVLRHCEEDVAGTGVVKLNYPVSGIFDFIESDETRFSYSKPLKQGRIVPLASESDINE